MESRIQDCPGIALYGVTNASFLLVWVPITVGHPAMMLHLNIYAPIPFFPIHELWKSTALQTLGLNPGRTINQGLQKKSKIMLDMFNIMSQFR